MIKRHFFICALLFVFEFTGVASAALIKDFGCKFCEPLAENSHIWIDGQDGINKRLAFSQSIDLSFDLANDGFDSGTDHIYFAALGVKIAAREDKTYRGWYTSDIFRRPYRTEFWHVEDGHDFALELLPVVHLNRTGKLEVTLTNKTLRAPRPFWVKSAYLGAVGCEKNPNPVPEPATMLLLGSGLVVIAGFGRKKIRNKDKK